MYRKISPWIIRPDCAMRVIEGSDPEQIKNRVAFIEKTPRIRIRSTSGTSAWDADHLNWCERPWKGDGADDQESMDWCDAMLRLMGADL